MFGCFGHQSMQNDPKQSFFVKLEFWAWNNFRKILHVLGISIGPLYGVKMGLKARSQKPTYGTPKIHTTLKPPKIKLWTIWVYNIFVVLDSCKKNRRAFLMSMILVLQKQIHYKHIHARQKKEYHCLKTRQTNTRT